MKYFRNPRFMVKVEPRTQSKSSYWVLYSNNWGITWNEIMEGNAPAYLSDSPHLMDRCHPLIFLSFDKAVEAAKKFKTLDDVKQYEAVRMEEFDKRYSKAVEIVEQRNKSWVSTD